MYSLGVGAVDLPLLVLGAALVLVGLGFKVAAVPFHMWTPDVYQGAPSSVTAFMSVGAKAAGFAALLRIFVGALPLLTPDMTMVIWIMAALTMFVGNVVAIAQGNIKRMLAYSSIAHAGYILMALVTYGQQNVSQNAVAAVLFYLVAYAFTSFGAWPVVIMLEKSEGEGLSLDSHAGLGRKYPRSYCSIFGLMPVKFPLFEDSVGIQGTFLTSAGVADTLHARTNRSFRRCNLSVASPESSPANSQSGKTPGESLPTRATVLEPVTGNWDFALGWVGFELASSRFRPVSCQMKGWAGP